MELSVFGAFNAHGAAARDLRKGSEADSNGAGFTETLSECIQSDGSAAPEAQGGGDVRTDAPKDATPHPGRFHNIRKKPCEDNGKDRGLDLNAPSQDGEPLEGATSVKNGEPLPAVGLVLSEGRRPADPKTQGIDNGGKDIKYAVPLYDGNAAYKAPSSAPDQAPLEGATSVKNGEPLPAVGPVLSEGRRQADPKTHGIDNGGKDIKYPVPLYDGNAAYKAPPSAPSAPSDTASASAGRSSGGGTDVLTPTAGPNEKPAQAAVGIDIGGGVSVNPENGASAVPGQAAADNADGRMDGDDDGGTEPQSVKGGFPRSERHGMALSGVSKDAQAAGTERARLDADKGAAVASSQTAQGGSSSFDGSGQSDGDGFEGDGNPRARFVKDAGPSGTAAFSVDKPAEKTSFDASKNTDTRTHNVAANNDIYDRLDSGLNMAVTRGAKEVSINLHPEHLGAIHIKLKMEDPSSNAVSARITVDSMEVKGALDADAGALKDAFSRQGLKLDGYTIEVGKNAFGIDRGDSHHSSGAGAWGGGGTGGFRDGPSHQGPRGLAARDGEISEGVHNGPTDRSARHGGVGSSGVDLFA